MCMVVGLSYCNRFRLGLGARISENSLLLREKHSGGWVTRPQEGSAYRYNGGGAWERTYDDPDALTEARAVCLTCVVAALADGRR